MLHPSLTLRRTLALTTLAAFAALALALPLAPAARAASAPRAGASRLLLPDLVAEAPAQLGLRVVPARGGARVKLGFRSAADNLGSGPLDIVGSRRSRRVPSMHADQLIHGEDGLIVALRIGELHFIRFASHQHWHLDGFMRYELRSVRAFRLVRPDEKAGFCLGDRYDVDIFTFLPSEPVPPPFTGECGLHEPGLLRVHEGISVGYGDEYLPQKEGQDIDITTAPSGRYWLVNRVDPGRRILESDRSNDAASLLLDVRWRRSGAHRRTVSVRVVRVCPHSATCSAGPPARTAGVSITRG